MTGAEQIHQSVVSAMSGGMSPNGVVNEFIAAMKFRGIPLHARVEFNAGDAGWWESVDRVTIITGPDDDDWKGLVSVNEIE